MRTVELAKKKEERAESGDVLLAALTPREETRNSRATDSSDRASRGLRSIVTQSRTKNNAAVQMSLSKTIPPNQTLEPTRANVRPADEARGRVAHLKRSAEYLVNDPSEVPRSSPLGWLFVVSLFGIAAIMALALAALSAGSGDWGRCIAFTAAGAIGGFGSWVSSQRYSTEKRRKADAEALRWPPG